MPLMGFQKGERIELPQNYGFEQGEPDNGEKYIGSTKSGEPIYEISFYECDRDGGAQFYKGKVKKVENVVRAGVTPKGPIIVLEQFFEFLEDAVPVGSLRFDIWECALIAKPLPPWLDDPQNGLPDTPESASVFRKKWEFRVKQGGVKYPAETYTLPDERPTPPGVTLPPLTRPRPPFDRLGPRIRPTHPGAALQPRPPTRADVAELGALLQQRRGTISTYAEENYNTLRTQELRERLRTSPPRPKHQHSCTHCGYKLPDEY